jgi:hypothetical protein
MNISMVLLSLIFSCAPLICAFPLVERKGIKSYVLKQMHFSVNDKNAIALKYFDLRTSAVQQFRKVNGCLKMAKQGRNMYQLIVIFMLF